MPEMDVHTKLRTYADPKLCQELLQEIKALVSRPLRFMEVCGTHTVSIYHSGLRALLPQEVEHISGPGCPVCVTHAREVAACVHLAFEPEVIVASFGDMLRVPDAQGRSLKTAKAQGADVRICYSPLDALEIASEQAHKQVVFLGVGFETTAPAVAAMVKQAAKRNIFNLSVLSCHKLIPPALRHLMQQGETLVDAFILPGHVCTIMGVQPFRFISHEFNVPGAVAGFEPADILMALRCLALQQAEGLVEAPNAYPRGVTEEGNRAAQAVMQEVFRQTSVSWRGLGRIEDSGLTLAPEYARFDAWNRFDFSGVAGDDPPGCRCGEVLKGSLHPRRCPLFGRTCTPSHPVGPCMVSTEGSCAAVFRYGLDGDLGGG